MSLNAIVAEKLSIGYSIGKGAKSVLYRNINFTLSKGELTTLMGVNGSGKSTLIKTISGIIPAIDGQVYIGNSEIKTLSMSQISQQLSIVLTERVADGGLKVEEVVSLGRYSYSGYFGKLSSEDKLIIDKAIDDVGIGNLVGRAISTLSDGERQKVMIAKSLAQMTDIIVLDEPAAFLDVKSRIEIMSLLRHLAATQNRAVLVSSHDLELAVRYSDNLWILSKDDNLYCGATEEMILSGNITKVVGDSENLYFDYGSGSFFPKNDNNDKLVELSGEESFWLKNALQREGWNISKNANIKIDVVSCLIFTIFVGNIRYNARSIKDVVQKLKFINNDSY